MIVRELGISIYPSYATKEQTLKYIELASKYGFKRIFTCLISEANKTVEELTKEYKEIISFANNCGMKVVADVEPGVFERYGVRFDDLSFFNNLGLYGIRLDT
jgi:hypothetical protein